MVKFIVALIFLFLFASVNSPAQIKRDTTGLTAADGYFVNDSAKINSDFNLALSNYNSSRFEDASKIFEIIAYQTSENAKTTISYLFYIKTLLSLKRFAAAEKVLNDFVIKYPSSKYVDEALATLAKDYFDQSNYYQSLETLSRLIDLTKSPYYFSYAKATGEKIAENYLSALQLKEMYDNADGKKSKPYILLLLGKLYASKNDFENADSAFEKLMKDFPNSEEMSEAVTIYQGLMNKKQVSPSTPLIGVMLPLSGGSYDASKISTEMLEGIKFALDVFNKEHTAKIGILIRDTERQKSKIKEIQKEFGQIPSLAAVIGPVYSDEVKDALIDFKDSGIPIISPTATDDDLTGLNKNFFQANPSFTMRGKIIADYIFYVENKRKMAVLNAVESYSPVLADSFIKEFQKLGGQIIIQETYNADSTSYNEQISRIAADTSQIDGLYLPLSDKKSVPPLLSQFAQFNLNVPIYGNQDWFLAKGYESYPALSNKLTFESDYFLDYSDSSFKEFSKSFFTQTNIDVDRNVLYGYDLAKYLLTVMENSPERQDVIKELISGRVDEGFHNNFCFGKDRVNNFLNIIRYKDGTFELVDKFRAGNN